jgi:hypothetical protein
MDEYDYFMVRIRRPGSAPPHLLCGVMERLGTGEKRIFESGEELLRLMGGEPSRPTSVQTGAPSGSR